MKELSVKTIIAEKNRLTRTCRVYQQRAERERRQRVKLQKAIHSALKQRGAGSLARVYKILKDAVSEGPSH